MPHQQARKPARPTDYDKCLRKSLQATSGGPADGRAKAVKGEHPRGTADKHERSRRTPTTRPLPAKGGGGVGCNLHNPMARGNGKATFSLRAA